MPRMITVLEDCVRYRDCKKWKRRHCFLTKSDSKKGTVTMFITKQFGISVTNQEIDEKSLRQYLIDEITGFEHGRHVDKESHVMALIGCNVVYCIAFEHTETMFRWAETLNKLLTSVNFHVTLKKVSETNGLFNKISVGTQGNLHVQQKRLCLIGEPADGNKFICEWSIGNLISIDILDTNCEKLKRLQIKSNGKSHKGKGHFEFEISINQKSVFEDTFRTFLSTCRDTNEEFKTNFILKSEISEHNADYSYSYSIICNDKTGSNSENSSSLEKRSSEIPIPRSREHSGPDQRPIENVQIKIRKSQKNLQKFNNQKIQKHYSTIETVNKNDNDECFFPDDEENEDLVQHKSQNFLCRGLSQESSGVCVSGPLDSMKDGGDMSSALHDNHQIISVRQDDSGCDILSPDNLLPSTTSNIHHDIIVVERSNVTGLPPYRTKHCGPKTNVYLTFYRDVCRNPLSLYNYNNYYRLLTTMFRKGNPILKRSNSFNCLHVSEIKRFEFCRKYSNVNFPLNLNSKSSDQHFKLWKEKISRESIESSFLGLNLKRGKEDVSKHLILNSLPFKTMKEFHGSMMRSLQSGTVCFNMFSYHHFLSLLDDVKTVIKSIEAYKLMPIDAAIEYRNLKDLICRKSKVYNHWLERIQSYSSSCDGTELSIIDINILLVFQIMDSIHHTRPVIGHEFADSLPRHTSYLKNSRKSELENDNFAASADNRNLLMPEFPRFGPALKISSSTPDFRDYCQQERVHKLSNIETGYQNLSSLDTFDAKNDSFSKHNFTKPITIQPKEGSFKRFRRKCSPNIFIPFIRRKTSSIHSTVSEPTYDNDTKEQNSYYNMTNQLDAISKRSLSVVLDNLHYVNMGQSYQCTNTSLNSRTARSTDYSDYANIDPSISDDNTSYPDEIIDPSRNYGNLNFKKSGMRYSSRHDTHSHNWSTFRRSSLSILSQKSYGTSRSSVAASSMRRGYSNVLSRVQTEACHDTEKSRFRSTDYINTNTLSTSPLSLQSCCAGQRPVPRSLNYVTVVEHSTCDRLLPMALQVVTQNDQLHKTMDDDLGLATGPAATRNYYPKRSWMTPQSSPIVDYCQIDVHGTYALRDIDRRLHRKKTARTTSTATDQHSRSPSPDLSLVHSIRSLERLPEHHFYTLSSSSFASCCNSIDKKLSSARVKQSSKRSIRRLFSLKSGSTN